MKPSLVLCALLSLTGLAHAAPKSKPATYARLGQAALHGAADSMLKRAELKSWFLDRKGTTAKSRVLGFLKIEDISLKKGVYRAKVATKSRGQDGTPQIRTSVRITKTTQSRYVVAGSRITWVNDIWE